MAYQNIGPGFDLIGTRTKPGQTQLEYFNTQNNQAFGNAAQLSSFVNPQYGLNTSPTDVFDVLKTGFTPRDQALNQIKEQLNQFQQDTFNQESAPAKRASSSLADSIATEQGNYDSATKEYQDLVEKLKALNAPNYEQSFAQLRNTAGLPGIENDFATNQKTIRELPYVNRMNFGNAGVATEGQLSADTEQKGIPLEIQQANLLDRLKLASDFVTNSLKFREMDQNASRQSLSDAIDAINQTINLSRTHLNDLLTQQQIEDQRQKSAQQFAFENRISKPFYSIDGKTAIRTSDQRPAHNWQEYLDMGGTGDFTDVQNIKAPEPAADYGKIGVDAEGNDQYGFVDTRNRTVTPVNVGGVTIPSGTLAFKNNNPGNLRYVGQAGASQGVGGFARFDSPEAGFQALISQIQLDANRGLTLSQFINKYAPPSENNTSQYIQQAISATGASANTPLRNIDINILAQFMAKKESGTTLSGQQTSSVENTLNASKGKDGYVDPRVYVETRSKHKKGPDDFDKRYGYLLSPQEQKRLGIAGGATDTIQFLTPDYFKQIYDAATLEKAAKDAGYVKSGGGFLGTGIAASTSGDVDAYLQHLNDAISQYRQAGFSDQEILKMMQK